MYSDYLSAVSTVTSKDSPFKSDPQYIGVLEHVSPEFGREYYALLQREYAMSPETIAGFCRINDSFGHPRTYTIDDLPEPVSPTSLRYLYHAARILRYAKGAKTFVEVGGGYGGLYLAMTYLSPVPIESYHLVDLDPVLRLQKLVLATYTNVVYHSASTFGKDVPDGCFFISNYCFSEIAKDLRDAYAETLIRRCSLGFLAWNTIPPYSFGRPIMIEVERPLTFAGNYYVYF